ncbi:putative peptidoglycan lipid II flippase [Nocardioides thalensis]|uniref:Putative peptidoglycan lipid II flippase n=1 Tax=Nocardioides thalensis TaxID=1914755 RepID=A0A853C983_9ACTN|nr:murein biosynthesis integral membrane protein MurJ [Nocardioides thalensis]NYJ03576.1 putative peptidoglycan lipid II flippase [Nocardioides thalensis]
MSDPIDPAGPSTPASPAAEPAGEQRRILANSAVMAAGTVVSRFSGFIRSTLLAAALGAGVGADVFTVANTVPNMLYILLAGGVFNAVLVPQLVRAMKGDADGGAAYVDRIMTLAVLFLGAVTVLLVIAAPTVMDVMLDADYRDPELAAQRQSAIDFARFCLPQVFFYGMFVLVGQVLNARGRFGPMMWAPIANNVIAVSVLVIYLLAFGPASEPEQGGLFTGGQEALLGIGSTVGILAQLVILVPFLSAAGVSYRPRFDFLHTGLGATFRLGVWTVLFVIVNQAAYVVVVRLASGGTAESDDGTGVFVYSSAQLVTMVPHSIITVSLATAILPRLAAHAAGSDLPALGRTLTDTIRAALVVLVPFALLLPVVADDIAQVIWGHGATAAKYHLFETPLSLFGAGIVLFTIHYLTLRGFYALELNRTVFFIQCLIAAVNVGLAVWFVGMSDAGNTAPALILAYTGAYGVGAAVSFAMLQRRIGSSGLGTLGGFALRLLVAAGVASAVAAIAAWVVGGASDQLPGADSWPWALLEGVLITAVDVVAFVVLARLLGLREVTSVLATVTGRLRRG